MAVQWGLLDPDMAAKVGGSFQQGQRNALAMQGAQQDQQMNALKMQQAQQEAQSQNALSEAYRSSGGDMAKLKENLLAGGHFAPAMQLSKIEAEQQKAALSAKKAELDDHVTKIGVVAQLLSSAHDQPSLDAAIQEAASVAGPEFVQNVPRTYNPTELQFAINKGLSVKDQAYNASKQIDQQLRQQEIQAMGGYRQQQLAQGNERIGIDRQQLGLQQQAAQNKSMEANQPKPMSEFQQYQIESKQAEKTSKAEEALGNIDDTINDFHRLKAIQEKTVTGPVAGSTPVTAVRKALPFDLGGGKNLQRLEKGYADLAVKAIGAFKAGGVTFGAMSDSENKWIKDTQEAINTDKEINKEMLDRGLKLLEGRKSRISKQLGATPVKATETTNDFSQPPQKGTIEDGHRFKGGDPADEKNWEKI